MSTDLEDRIRTALRERAAEVSLQQTERRTDPRRGRHSLLLVAASVIVVLAIVVPLVILRGSSTPPAAPANGGDAGFVGYHWRITAIHDKYGVLDVPADLHPSIGFGTDGEVLADDTVNGYDGRYRVTPDGYVPFHVAGTLVGYVGPARSSRIRISNAIDSVVQEVAVSTPTRVQPDPEPRVRARVHGDELVLRSGTATVVAVRAGAQPIYGDPSSTPSATSHPVHGSRPTPTSS